MEILNGIVFNSQPQAYWIIAIYDGLYACG
jgi:hypothetical protein